MYFMFIYVTGMGFARFRSVGTFSRENLLGKHVLYIYISINTFHTGGNFIANKQDNNTNTQQTQNICIKIVQRRPKIRRWSNIVHI